MSTAIVSGILKAKESVYQINNGKRIVYLKTSTLVTGKGQQRLLQEIKQKYDEGALAPEYMLKNDYPAFEKV